MNPNLSMAVMTALRADLNWFRDHGAFTALAARRKTVPTRTELYADLPTRSLREIADRFDVQVEEIVPALDRVYATIFGWDVGSTRDQVLHRILDALIKSYDHHEGNLPPSELILRGEEVIGVSYPIDTEETTSESIGVSIHCDIEATALFFVNHDGSLPAYGLEDGSSEKRIFARVCNQRGDRRVDLDTVVHKFKLEGKE
jgi:hypothetical protein